MENKSQERKQIIVCIEDYAKAITLFRIAQSRALNIGGEWRAVLFDTVTKGSEENAQKVITKLNTLARQMSGKAVHISGDSAEKMIADMLIKEKERMALVLVSNTDQKTFLFRRSSPSAVIARVARKLGVPVESISFSESRTPSSFLEVLSFSRVMHIAYAIIAVGFSFVVALILRQNFPPALFRLNNQNIGLLFMIACAFSAGRFGLIPGLVASIASFFIMNWFFTFPYYQLNLSSVTDLLNMGIFLFATLLISVFAGKTHGVAKKASERELSANVLFSLYRIASDISSRNSALQKLQSHLSHTLDMDIAFFMPSRTDNNIIEPAFPYDVSLSDIDMKALELCWKEAKETGAHSPSFRESTWLFRPMLSQGGVIGVIGARPRARKQVDAWFGSLLMAVADQVATIIEHIDLANTMEETRISEEREKLRSMLLSSVSHDLKTPLSSIIGALNIYRTHASKIDEQKRLSLIETALGEAERLENFIANILDMTRLESKKIKFKQNWHNPHFLVQEVLQRLHYRLRNHKFVTYPCAQQVEIYMDYVMTGQVLQNIIDNACKYALQGTIIELRMFAEKDGGFFYEIRDHGVGIPPEKMEHIFDKYARLQRRDSQVAGTGLGLAISKAIVEVQGGNIKVSNHPEGGAIFIVNIPHWRTQERALQTG